MQNQDDVELDMNLVEHWVRKDTPRLLAGALTGLVGGVATLFLAMYFCAQVGLESLYPLKLFATIFLGSGATELGDKSEVLLTGGVMMFALFIFLGLVFSHFVFTNNLTPLIWMGLVWGAFSWIFIWNLFLQAFKPIAISGVSSGAALIICLAFGLSLSILRWVDPLFRS